VSESNQQQKQQTDKPQQKGKAVRTPSNPFEGSALFSSAPALPEMPAASFDEVVQQTQASAAPAAPIEQKEPFLYNTPAPAAYQLLQFEKRHDRQTIYIDARKAGALDALVQLVARKNKTDLVDEMVTDILAKYATVLQENEEMVRILEERYRKKHNL